MDHATTVKDVTPGLPSLGIVQPLGIQFLLHSAGGITMPDLKLQHGAMVTKTRKHAVIARVSFTVKRHRDHGVAPL